MEMYMYGDAHAYRDLLFEQLMAGDPPGTHVFKVGDAVNVSAKSRQRALRMTVFEVFTYTAGQIVYASAPGLGSIRFPWLTKHTEETVQIGGHTWWVSKRG